MTRSAFFSAFLVGLLAVVWMAWVFAGSDGLAFFVTCLIGCVFLGGAAELFRFHQATESLARALNRAPRVRIVLHDWLSTFDGSLQNAVRLRIEGERVGLPAPVLTPYLVGLLVMLGLMGTFLGMVATLNGAVMALEGATELQAMRAGLVAPMKGLGFAFGTSVAGVATSAMLGLMSAVCRRDRMDVTRCLDTKIATDFREFSLTHHRQETYKALQQQTLALPLLTQTLERLNHSFSEMGDTLGDRLMASQDTFYSTSQKVMADVSRSVERSLRETVVNSGRLVAEQIRPIMTEFTEEIRAETTRAHHALAVELHQQFDSISEQLCRTSREIASAWQRGISAQDTAIRNLLTGFTQTQQQLTEQFEAVSAEVIEAFKSITAEHSEQQARVEAGKLEAWIEALAQVHQQATSHMNDTSKAITADLAGAASKQQQALSAVMENFKGLTAELTAQLRQAALSTEAQQEQVMVGLAQSASALSDHTKNATDTLLGEIGELLQTTEFLVDARVQTEAAWLQGHESRMADLTAQLTQQLERLRTEEAQRGDAATARLADLESTVVVHLSTLGQALEEPLAALIETASETPRAAAQVISQLRAEISKNIERDNVQLEERCQLMNELKNLSSALADATQGQRMAIDELIQSSANTLTTVGAQFTSHVNTEVANLTEVANTFASSTLEMASLGEGFGLAVNLFNSTNEQLTEGLNQIVQTLTESVDRSDQQLAYYVAQAREVIDYSIASQKEVVDTLRKMPQPRHQAVEEAG